MLNPTQILIAVGMGCERYEQIVPGFPEFLYGRWTLNMRPGMVFRSAINNDILIENIVLTISVMCSIVCSNFFRRIMPSIVLLYFVADGVPA